MKRALFPFKMLAMFIFIVGGLILSPFARKK